jgi:hypothetical protein
MRWTEAFQCARVIRFRNVWDRYEGSDLHQIKLGEPQVGTNKGRVSGKQRKITRQVARDRRQRPVGFS